MCSCRAWRRRGVLRKTAEPLCESVTPADVVPPLRRLGTPASTVTQLELA